ncbi:dihydropteridine reductase [Pelomyxa schiedti]|nr:dihydropteridine reductase [Pelomyxa schiedti]
MVSVASDENESAFKQLILTRRSCREYKSTPVPRELIDKCLDAARVAPSACNSQPWSFIVVDTQPLKDAVADAAFSGVHGVTGKFAKTAPVIIVCVTEVSNYAARLGGWLRSVQYNLIDIGIACDHLTLQATELGLGTCWIGWFSEAGIKTALKLPASTKIDVIIALGYPTHDATVNTHKPRNTLDQVRRYA